MIDSYEVNSDGSVGDMNPHAQQVAQEVADELMSPYCPGRTIASCPSQAARELELEILDQANQGATREEIEASLVQRFGSERVGSQPGDWATTVIVVIGVLLAAIVIVVRVRRWVGAKASRPLDRQDPSAGLKDSHSPSQGELDQLEDALDEVTEI